MQEFFVGIVEYETDEVVKRLGPFTSERTAEKCCDGVDRNLNHDRFYTQIETTGEDTKMMKQDKREKYESEQRKKDGLLHVSIRLDAETRQLLADASEIYGGKREAIREALKNILKK